MADLTAKQRQKLPSKDFALPGKGEGKGGKGAGSYPIPDKAHARNALARVSQHGSSKEKAEVRRKVAQKYPGIGQSPGQARGGGEKKSGERRNSGGREKRLGRELERRLGERDRR